MLQEYITLLSKRKDIHDTFSQESYDYQEAHFILKYFKGSQDNYNRFTSLYHKSISQDECHLTNEIIITFEMPDHTTKGVRFIYERR